MVESIDDSGDKVKVTVSPASGGESRVLEADKVLQAIGFSPRTDGFGLDKTGVELTDQGAIKIDNAMRTTVPHIFAIGDVTAKLMLAHNAEAMGIVAAETIGGVTSVEIDYDMVPRATFCQPQIGSFGYTEQQAQERGYDVKVAKFPFAANGKAHGLGEATGFVKLVADADRRILGAHMIGPEVTELLPELTLAQRWGLTADQVAYNIHAHPTLSETLKEVAHGISGHMINL
jgi:dihydrolipoamide dehydrogenase